MSTTGASDDGDRLRLQHDEPYVATVTERADGVAVCPLSRLPETDGLLLSEWVLASGESFVALEGMR